MWVRGHHFLYLSQLANTPGNHRIINCPVYENVSKIANFFGSYPDPAYKKIAG